jgi:hypothetical protein
MNSMEPAVRPTTTKLMKHATLLRGRNLWFRVTLNTLLLSIFSIARAAAAAKAKEKS